MTPSRASLVLFAAAAAAAVGVGLALRPAPQAPSASPAAPVARAPARGGQWFDAAMLHAAPAARTDFVTAPQAPIYGRNGRTIDFGGKDAAAYIDERAAAARTGDLRAAYQVYQAASACAASEEPLPEFLDPAEGQAAARERARVRGLCARVSPVQLQERMRFLVNAADGGNREARIDYFMEGPNGQPLAQADPADPQVQQWQQQAAAYLKQAAAECDQFALGLLENAYDIGQFGPRDPGQAMAYAIASSARRDKPLSGQQLRERFGADLAPAAFDAALRQGAQLSGTACPAKPAS